MAIKNKTVRTWVRFSLAVGTIVSLFFVPWIIVWAWLLPLPDSVQAQAEQAIEHGFDGMVVYVQQGQQPAQFYSAGWNNRELKTPADAKALFKIASIDKLYYAAALIKLVGEQKLNLDRSLAYYFPELVDRIEFTEQISLRMLLQHRSGIPNYTDYPNYWQNPRHSYPTKLELILDKPANFQPDSRYQYSNSNYLLIGELIKRTALMSQHDYIKQVILQPLNLNDTYASIRQIDIKRLMGGYYVGYEQDIKTNDYGSMIATVEDVGRFLRALANGSLFTPEEQAIYQSVYHLQHGGLIPGYQSQASYFADIDTVIVQVINTTDFNGYDWNLSQLLHSRIEKIVRQQQRSE